MFWRFTYIHTYLHETIYFQKYIYTHIHSKNIYIYIYLIFIFLHFAFISFRTENIGVLSVGRPLIKYHHQKWPSIQKHRTHPNPKDKIHNWNSNPKSKPPVDAQRITTMSSKRFGVLGTLVFGFSDLDLEMRNSDHSLYCSNVFLVSKTK